MMAFDTNLFPMVGQQVTVTSANGSAVAQRLTDMLAAAAANQCDVIVKGLRPSPGNPTVFEQRGWVRTAAGTFRSDRKLGPNAEPLINESTLRGQAANSGEERTYMAVPPGSGTRIGVDRDEDGFFDRDELDAGSDPADPLSTPGGPTTTSTTTTTTVTGPTSSTTTTTLPGGAFTLIPVKSLSLKDDNTPPINTNARKVKFKSSTKLAPNKIIPPAQGGPNDPRDSGGLLSVYNSDGGPDFVSVALAPENWSALGSTGYRFADLTGPIQKIIVKPDSILVKGGKAAWTYSLNEPSQGHVAVRLLLGNVGWCTDAAPKSPASNYDRVDRFVAAPAVAPAICP